MTKRPKKSAELDSKTFKMSDLIAWKPKTENELRKKWDARRQELLDRMENEAPLDEDPKADQSQDVPKTQQPRVKLNDKGEMIIDSESLLITEKPEDQAWDTVQDDLMPKKLNSLSFRKRTSVRSGYWTAVETDLFYLLLSATGCDFSLMHEFLPSRSRVELKKKFKKEERTNIARVNEAMKKPSLLEKDYLYETAKQMIEQSDAEKKEKEEKKRAIKSRNGKPTLTEDSTTPIITSAASSPH